MPVSLLASCSVMRTSEEQTAAEVISELQELLVLTEAAQIFEQISLVAVVKMCNIDWTGITVRCPGQLEVPVQPQTSTVTDQDLQGLRFPYILGMQGKPDC